MSYREQFIAAWVTQQQRAFRQSTRGIMTPEARQVLEDEAEKAMAEVERAAAEKAWWGACLRIADGENNLDIAHVYQKQNPYLDAALGLTEENHGRLPTDEGE